MKEYHSQLEHIRTAIDSGATSVPAVVTEMKLRGYVVLTSEEVKRGRENAALLERQICCKVGTCSMADQTALFKI